jgi:hypothetical protein
MGALAESNLSITGITTLSRRRTRLLPRRPHRLSERLPAPGQLDRNLCWQIRVGAHLADQFPDHVRRGGTARLGVPAQERVQIRDEVGGDPGRPRPPPPDGSPPGWPDGSGQDCQPVGSLSQFTTATGPGSNGCGRLTVRPLALRGFLKRVFFATYQQQPAGS